MELALSGIAYAASRDTEGSRGLGGLRVLGLCRHSLFGFVLLGLGLRVLGETKLGVLYNIAAIYAGVYVGCLGEGSIWEFRAYSRLDFVWITWKEYRLCCPSVGVC